MLNPTGCKLGIVRDYCIIKFFEYDLSVSFNTFASS